MGKSKQRQGQGFGSIVFLLGFMGSGKSYWGQRLAKQLDWDFLDLDEILEQKADRPIAAIFAALGEGGFREMERDVLRDLAFSGPAVVATGGGTPCFFDNLDWMKAQGLTIYLLTAPEILAQRLLPDYAHRPLLASLEAEELLPFIAAKLTERRPFYQEADAVVVVERIDQDILPMLLDIARQYTSQKS